MNDDDFGSPREVELVDSFAIDLTFPVGTVTDRTTYNGQFGLAQIDLSFNLVCLEPILDQTAYSFVTNRSQIAPVVQVLLVKSVRPTLMTVQDSQ